MLSLILFIVILIVCLLLLRTFFTGLIRQKVKVTASNGIDSIEYVEINGIQQAIHIKGNDQKNPILLFLHGGPGFTEMPVSYRYQKEWEDHFIVVQWDQRSAGKTYVANRDIAPANNDGIKLRVNDCIQLSEFLLARFQKEKLVLTGHSWGSVLGICTIKEKPELFSTFIGIGQLVNLADSEVLGYQQTVSLAEQANNEKDLHTLQKLLPYPNQNQQASYTPEFAKKMMSLRKLQGEYEIGMPASYIENFRYFVCSPYYSLRDLSYYLTDVFSQNYALYQWLYEDFDLRQIDLQFEIPMIFIYGQNDWTTPYSLFEEEVFDRIQSPKKELHILDHAAHRPMNDNPSAFLEILKKIHD